MMIPFMRGSAGLNVKVDPVRLQYDPETGVQFLAEAVNVDVDITGRVSRRKGLRKIADLTGAHSLWGNQYKAFVLADDKLYAVFLDGTLTQIKDGLSGGPGYYCEAGPDVYFSNGDEMGIIKGLTWHDWVQTPYIGPVNDRQYMGPMAGKHLCMFRGRLAMAVDQFVLYSEPFNYGCFDSVRGFIPIPGSQVLMIAPVDDGIYVSSDTGVFFMHGSSLADVEFRHVADEPAIEGSYADARAIDIDPEFHGRAAVFTLQGVGVVLGMGQGFILRLTDSRVDMPPASQAFAVTDRLNDNRYTCFLEV